MSDAKATRKRGTGRLEVAKQGHMAGHKRIKDLLDRRERLRDAGFLGERGRGAARVRVPRRGARRCGHAAGVT
jgi:hypothetical protein